MPSHCCVPKCKANSRHGTKVSVYSFPKNEELVKKWLSVIPRENFQPTPSTKICRRHFTPDDIVTEASAYDSKRKVTVTVPLKNYRLKRDAVPSIFEDLPVNQSKKVKKSSLKDNQEKDSIESSEGTSMQRKSPKSPLSSSFEVNKANKSNRQDDEKKGAIKSPKRMSTVDQSIRAVSPKKTPSTTDQPTMPASTKKPSLTTYRPIISVIKAEDRAADEQKSPERVAEDNDCVIESPSSKSFSLPSPFKNLPSVSVCLKEEDRVPFTRELKGVKRSPSTGSNSSTGSTDVQKSGTNLTKRKKIEKPAPIVIGRQNDCYCWVCHRENIVLCCIACPRAYHNKCAGEMSVVSPDWVCPECQRILAAENVDTRSSTLSEISLDKLCALLKLSLNKMKQRAPIAFHQPVSLEHYPLYLHYVIHPMDFSLLEKNIKKKLYGCTEAFLADVKWIAHNSCVFNGTQHPLSTNAKNLVKSCDQDMQEIEVCPDCFVHSVVRNKYWFSEVCRKPHPLVWAKLKGFPYWPAKVVRIVDGNVDARFFGAHDRAWVPVSQCYHLSKEMPTTSKPKKKGNYEVALDELNVHVHLLIQKFGCFEYAPYRTSFNTQNKYLMYHGIDIDKANKEDISVENSTSQSEIKFYQSEKENRFASFMESESEKSNVDENNLNKSQSEIQHNSSLDVDEGAKPSFLKEKKSVDSLLSEKKTLVEESNEQRTMIGLNKNDETKTDSEKISTVKEPEKISDSDQLRKLELALERIKGYVSLNDDVEKETGEVESEEKEVKETVNEKSTSEKVRTDNTSKTGVSPLFKKLISLPVVESSTALENVEDLNVRLQTAKNTDPFFQKLNQTIESCKAKLGISEINDDISSDESGGVENASKSDEDEESSASEAEEVSEEEEGENMEISDDEAENDEDEENKLEDKGESGDSDEEGSESDEESNSLSSDTDIECTNGISSKKVEKSNILNNVHSVNESDKRENEAAIPNENCVKEMSIDSSEAIITNPDMQVPEVTIEDSGSLQIAGDNSLSQSSNEIKENSKSLSNDESSEVTNSETSPKKDNNIPPSTAISISLDVDKDSCLNVDNEISGRTASAVNCNVNENQATNNFISSSSNKISPLSEVSVEVKPNLMNLNSKIKENGCRQNAENSPTHCRNKTEEDDDDIFICTPTRPKSPPVIVLDDDQENDDSHVSDTLAVKYAIYSSSESLSSDEIPIRKTTSDDEHDNPRKTVSVDHRLSTERLDKSELNGEVRNKSNKSRLSETGNPIERRKRKLSSDSSSSEDEIQIVTPVKKTILTGAIRTFNKPDNNNAHSLKPVTPTIDTVKRNLEKESLNQINKLSVPVVNEVNKSSIPPENCEMETNISPQGQTSVLQSPESPFSGIGVNPTTKLSPVIDVSKLSDKDKEILFLRGKLNCIMTAYKIQSWKCNQEREELRHNMNLILMEMRASLESDKKQAIEALVRKLEQEKQKCIEETKRKQWCASCLMESRYACCWNTSYCSIDCQKHHFPEHRNSCTQLKNKNIEIVEVKQKPVALKSSESNENKKVFIFNMKSSENAQQNPISKPQIQVMPAKNALQIASSSNSNNNIQFLLAPVKSPAESAITSTSTLPSTSAPEATTDGMSPKEQNLDSAQIINQVRNKVCDLGTAISLLKKKNMESSLSLVNREEKEKPKEETNLEEIYFPSPPKVTFEGYESASPEPNLVIMDTEENNNYDNESQESELSKNASPEPDVILSDTDDMDNEMFHIGFGIDVKAKFLNKCLIYGQTAKKLTRCLMDVIFPDAKLLASCSAFGQKSNVTKLTRAALPTRKVHAIIDFVRKRYPEASRSEIVLAINMKCKEARAIINRKGGEKPRRASVAKRLLGLKKDDDVVTTDEAIVTTTTAATTTTIVSSPVVTTSFITPPIKTTPNVVCVKSSNQSQSLPFNMPNKSAVPNILRCGSQILIRPKPILNSMGNAAILQPRPPKKSETVKKLLANKMNLSMGNLSKDGTKLVMALDTHKPSTASTQPVTTSSTSTSNTRPYIIIGSHVNAVKPSSVQHPALPISSHIKK